MSKEEKVFDDVHTRHCCAIHGCKYGDKDCTVVVEADKNQNYVQESPCMDCDDDGIDTVRQLIQSIHPTYRTFTNQVVMYAKSWYGDTKNIKGEKDRIFHDLKILLSNWSGIDVNQISDRDIQENILSAFVECVENPHHQRETLLEAFGWRWGRNESVMSDREPEVALMGKLSIVEAKYVFMPDKLDITFEEDVDIPAST